MADWNARFSTDEYVFGRQPNIVLERHKAMFLPGESVLAVADGEGRNGVFLASLGLDVHAVDASDAGLEKAARLAQQHNVALRLENVDLLRWEWPESTYDHVVGIFIQFADPEQRIRLFEGMKTAVRPGGHVFVVGYRPEQIELGTGGPGNPDHMYTTELLQSMFDGFEIQSLVEEDVVLKEGRGHDGLSAIISLIARKPVDH